MLAIRLARVGKKKQPTYRLTVTEKTKDTFGDFLEILGNYNPRTKVCEVNKERILHWISKGAKPSPTVHNLLIDQNVIQADKVRASKSKKKKGSDTEAKAEPNPSAGSGPDGKEEAVKPEQTTEAKEADPPVGEAEPEEKKEEAVAEEKKPEEKKEADTEVKAEEKKDEKAS